MTVEHCPPCACSIGQRIVHDSSTHWSSAPNPHAGGFFLRSGFLALYCTILCISLHYFFILSYSGSGAMSISRVPALFRQSSRLTSPSSHSGSSSAVAVSGPTAAIAAAQPSHRWMDGSEWLAYVDWIDKWCDDLVFRFECRQIHVHIHTDNNVNYTLVYIHSSDWEEQPLGSRRRHK
jgi:hypothetical protein